METNLEKAKKRTIVKLILMALSILLPILILSFVKEHDKNEVGNDLRVIRIIVAVIFEVLIVKKLVIYSLILAKPEFRKNYYLKLKDERNVYIRQRTNAFTIKLLLYIEAIAMVLSGMYSGLIFYTLGAVIVLTAIIYYSTKLYFNSKN